MLRILDEFVAVTGYHRKHIIRLFNAAPVSGRLGRRARLPVYDEAVREALILLWEASDRVCGKRLKPLLPLLVTALEGRRDPLPCRRAAVPPIPRTCARARSSAPRERFKLASKTRVGAKVHKTYHAPETPYARLL